MANFFENERLAPEKHVSRKSNPLVRNPHPLLKHFAPADDCEREMFVSMGQLNLPDKGCALLRVTFMLSFRVMNRDVVSRCHMNCVTS
jgi:hypothetical protein